MCTPSRGAAAGLGAGSPDAGAGAGGNWMVGVVGLQSAGVATVYLLLLTLPC